MLCSVPGLVLFAAGWGAVLVKRVHSDRASPLGLRASMIGFGLFVLGLWLGAAGFMLISGEVLPAFASATIGVANAVGWFFITSKATLPKDLPTPTDGSLPVDPASAASQEGERLPSTSKSASRGGRQLKDRNSWFDPLWLLFPNTVASLVIGLVVPFVALVLVLALGLAGLLK